MIRRCAALRGLFLLMATLLSAGCQSPRESLQALAAGHGQRVELIHTRDYPVLYSAVRVPAAPTLQVQTLAGNLSPQQWVRLLLLTS